MNARLLTCSLAPNPYSMTAHSCNDLKKNLSLLKAKQRQRQRCYLYRSLLVSAFASGILAIIMSYNWQIKAQSQVIVRGDRFLAASAIFNLLQLSYPQSIVSFSTQNIEERLQSIPALQSVRVTKALFPPSINIYLQEKIPVATALSSGKVGFLDSQGVLLEPNLYDDRKTNFPPTKIKVVNFQPQYSKVWSEIYRLTVAYPSTDVKEVRWDNAGNLFLRAKNFRVILGSNRSLLAKQFATLASFPDFTTDKKLHNIAQIDLTNPDTPFLEQDTDTLSNNK
jgi:cell division protein FtsQ